MSKPDKFDIEVNLVIKNEPIKLITEVIQKTLKNNDRVETKIRVNKGSIKINILANDINVIRSVINTILLSIKMLSEVNRYE